MTAPLLAALVLLIGLLSACSPAVTVQQKLGVDFSPYRTYDWAKTDVKSADSNNPIYKSTLNDERPASERGSCLWLLPGPLPALKCSYLWGCRIQLPIFPPAPQAG